MTFLFLILVYFQLCQGKQPTFPHKMDLFTEDRRLRTFRPDSKIYSYLVSKGSELIKKGLLHYRFITIRLALELIIDHEGLFDPLNRQIIVCDQDLEKALDRRSLHCSQLHALIKSQLTPIKISDGLTSARLCQAERNRILSLYSCRLTYPPHVSSDCFDINAEYFIKPHFMAVLRCSSVIQNRFSICPYRSVCNALSDYLMARKSIFFDLRNVTICNAIGDPLAKAFNVNYFSRCQVTRLIRSQCIPIRRSKRVKRLSRRCKLCN